MSTAEYVVDRFIRLDILTDIALDMKHVCLHIKLIKVPMSINYVTTTFLQTADISNILVNAFMTGVRIEYNMIFLRKIG